MHHFPRRVFSVLALAGFATAARAGDLRSFVIPPSDGYGVGECLSAGGDCGRVVADSWCSAYGFGHATAFGRADDVTSAIAVASASKSAPPPGSYIITCSE